MLFNLSFLAGSALLLLRVIVGIIFASSGRRHINDPQGRSESLGMSPTTTWILGAVELAAAIALILGVYIQIAALLLIGVMLGAMYKKIFVWETGFYADKGYGWHYDLLLLAANAVFATVGGGALTIL